MNSAALNNINNFTAYRWMTVGLNWPSDFKSTDFGHTLLKSAIARVASGLPEVGRAVPKRWQEAREALKQTGAAYLPLERVLALCASAAWTNPRRACS